MNIRLFFAASVLALAGMGCAPSAVPVSTTTTTGAPSATSTAVTPAIPENGWLTWSNHDPDFSFDYPSFATDTSSASAYPEDVVTKDLGAMVQDTSASSVPTVMLHVKVLSPTDPHLHNCFYSDSEWPTGFEPMSASMLNLNGTDFCLTKESDVGAGNYYNTWNYATAVQDQIVVFSFIVHSVNCLNYPNPATQCIAYDDVRDTVLFQPIVETFRGAASTSAALAPAFQNQSVYVSSTGIEVNVTYPHLADASNAAQDFNALMDSQVHAVTDEFQNEFASATADMEDTSGPDGGWTLDMDYEVHRLSPTVFSVIVSGDEYTGGAHGNSVYVALTYDLAHDTPLVLSDLFKPGTPYLSEISKASASLLKQRNGVEQFSDPDWIAEGTSADAGNFQFFYVTPDGLGIVFPPYQVAAYAAGEQRVDIPKAQLPGWNR